MPLPLGDLRADKRLGQHFLHDRRLIERIADTLPLPTLQPVVLEIGPGPGALTQVLLERGYTVHVVEKDPRWQAAMRALGDAHEKRVQVVGEDALQVDWTTLLADGIPVIGNLPYNVGTEIVADLVRLPNEGSVYPSVMVFMLQKEVVQRICAKPDLGRGDGGSRADWGRLGVLCDLMSDREMLFDVSPGAFNPPPKVMSSVVRLTPLPAPRFNVDLRELDTVLRHSFGQRRKMLRAALRGLLTEPQIDALGIDPTARAETLTTAQFCQLANTL